MRKKIKYIIYGSNADYLKFCLSDILNNDNVVFIGGTYTNTIQKYVLILTFFLHKIFKSSNSLNRLFFPLFFKRKWVTIGEIPVFWFFEQNNLSYNKLFLLYLKKLFPESKMVFYFTNVVGKGNKLAIDIINKNISLYNIVITFYEKDAQAFNLIYYPWIYSPISIINKSENVYDLLFVGLDKGRINILKEIAILLKNNNLVYDFNVIETDNIDNKKYGIKTIQERMSYKENIDKVLKSKCVLELMPYDVQGCSLRTAEIIATGTKLLTNNLSLKSNSIYNESQMSVFSSPDNIDVEFLKRDIDTNLFNNRDMLSPKLFLNFLETVLFS